MSGHGPTKTLESRWTITEGRAPNGRAYNGSLEITEEGEAWRLRWHINGESGSSNLNGVGFWLDGVLYASRSNVRTPESSSSFPGIVVYEAGRFGYLPATWYHPELQGRMGKGVSVDGPTDGLPGEYVAEYGSSDTAFDPLTKEIRQVGGQYRLVWRLGDDELYNGVGASFGERLAVAWAKPPRSDLDLVRFERDSTSVEMAGAWCSNEATGATGLGIEIVRPLS